MTQAAAPFGAELRRLRLNVGYSLAKLADRVHYSKSYLSKVENGNAPPNESLAAMCDEVLRANGALTALLAGAGGRRRSRRKSDATRPFGLPTVTTHFTGRAAEIAEVLAALRQHTGPCVLNGMAGAGKTSLAVWCGRRVAAHFPDGVLFMDLRGHTPGVPTITPARALDRLLRLLAVPGEAIPADTDDRASVFRGRLRGRAVLIVLDNAGSAEQVVPLLPAEEKCRVLVTSRHRLAALDDARHVQVGVLGPDEGANLLRSLLTGQTSDDCFDDGIVADVVERCGRLPLAIRIAAARLKANPSWTLGDLRRRLETAENKHLELDDGERSVASVFRSSVAAMPADQQRLLGLLAIHPCTDFDLPAAAALSDLPEPAAERLLGQLRNGHLIEQEKSGRYHWHDLLRSFTAHELAGQVPNGEQVQALTRLIEMELHATDTADRLLASTRYRREVVLPNPPAPIRSIPDTDAALSWLHTEWANLVALCRVALDLGLHTHAWQLAFGLRSYFFITKLWDPWIESHHIALAAAEADGDGWAQGTALNNLGVATIDRGDLDGAGDYYCQALARFRIHGQQRGTSTTKANQAWIDHYRGDHGAALEGMRAALTHYRNVDATRNAAITLRGMALVESALGQYDEATRHINEAMNTFTTLDLDLDITMTHNCMGWVYFSSGQYADAEAAYATALASCDSSTSTFEAARAEIGLGNVAAMTGRPADARQFWTTSNERGIRLDPITTAEEMIRQKLDGPT